MPSAFPGMDPWLESTRYFGDLHDSLITFIQEALQPQLPEPYFARKTIRIWLESPDRRVSPDVYVVKSRTSDDRGEYPAVASIGETGPLVVTAEPPEMEEVTEQYLDVYTLEGGERRLVTSIEILSPTNKGIVGDGRTPYLQKQREMLKSQVHLIEIDLLRGGRHTTSVPEHKIAKLKDDYHVCLSCFDQRDRFYVYPFGLADPLPDIAVPLLPGDPVLTISLQPIFDRSYDAGGFNREIRYDAQTPDPPLTEKQADWANAIVSR